MKKVLALTMFLGLLFFGTTNLIAQKKYSKKQTTTTQNTDTKKTESETRKNNDQVKIHKSTGFNKNGSPDMRLKANKQAKQNASTQPGAVTTSTSSIRTTTTQRSVNNSAAYGDKVIGTDDKGRTIYEGKRGGHYYINKNGNKEYVKRS